METLISSNKTKVAFLGVGWIGLNRLNAANATGVVEIAGIADTSKDSLTAADCGEDVAACNSLEELINLKPDGIVIATPSALHAAQALKVLERNIAVFCQKPLGRNAAETHTIVKLAEAKNLLLGVDFSYRYTCFRLLHKLIQQGEIGKIYAMELCFHNAYGPDKSWFYDKKASGGGCVIDLGVHLLDLAVWCLPNQNLQVKDVALFHKGKRINGCSEEVEDHAMVSIHGKEGCSLQLNCSWNLAAGKEAEIHCNIYGTAGGLSFKNVNGSFYDFEALRFRGTQTEILFSGADAWGGRAIADWCRSLRNREGFDPQIKRAVDVATLIDAIYEKQ